MKKTDQELLDCYFQGRASDEEVAELEQRMLADADLRQRYLEEAMCETDLRSLALREENVITMPKAPRKQRPAVALLAGAVAALLVLATILILKDDRPASVGRIVSSELAGWQSDQSTIEGAEFGPGTYLLQRGVATLEFHSGAQMVLEGPAKIEVVSEMQLIFDYGNASFNVPESAVGFQIDTRYGHIVDHGTRFSLSLGKESDEALLAVLEGEIAIHHSNGEVKHLFTDETVRIDAKQLQSSNYPASEGELDAREPFVTLGTGGRETSIIYKDQYRKTKLSSDILMVKHARRHHRVKHHADHNRPRAIDRRALLAFDVSGIDLEKIAEARLILNVVPTGLGMVTAMPKVSEFGLYGIPDDEREQWPNSGLRWVNAPKLEDSTRLATFPVSRAEQRAVVILDTPQLLAFLKADRSGELGFMIHCETLGASL
ncbi:MAG: FecR domain-containing protein, partial [Akkermansiaceae bacterium]|nr:FecR domain-containing protein [Akkermansiaceae bacterium]MDG2323119.1 FecR domain-containing protein [Akkermansiaceae bacterium]